MERSKQYFLTGLLRSPAPTVAPPNLTPHITMVKPAIVPIQGGVTVHIQGTNFKPGLSIVIGGVKIAPASCLLEPLPVDGESQNRQVRVLLPQMKETGPLTIILINPDQNTAILKDVLICTDDPVLLQSFKEKNQIRL